MKIAVNTRLLQKNRLEGIGRFTDESLRRIVAEHPEHEFVFLFDRMFSPEFVYASNVTPLVVPPPTRHPVLWKIWFDFMLPRVFKKLQPDLFLSTDGYMSLKTNVPTVDVIHDINFAHNPKQLPRQIAKYYNKYFPKFAQAADRICTVSEFSKQDIAKTYSIAEDKIDVVYNGSSESFGPLLDFECKLVQEKYTKGNGFFLYVGSLHPRKNIGRLLQAYDQFAGEHTKPLNLMIVGEAMFLTKEIDSIYRAMKHREKVVFTGRLSSKELARVTASARAMVFVPLFEGFGIPIIEAMASETPVICSNTTSMPEVAGDATILVEPTSTRQIAGAMRKLADDDELCQTLIEKGKEQCQKFTWDKTADLLWQSMMKTLSK